MVCLIVAVVFNVNLMYAHWTQLMNMVEYSRYSAWYYGTKDFMSVLGIGTLHLKVSSKDHSFVLRVSIVYYIYYVLDSTYPDYDTESTLVPFRY
jgi:hypothetical protein